MLILPLALFFSCPFVRLLFILTLCIGHIHSSCLKFACNYLINGGTCWEILTDVLPCEVMSSPPSVVCKKRLEDLLALRSVQFQDTLIIRVGSRSLFHSTHSHPCNKLHPSAHNKVLFLSQAWGPLATKANETLGVGDAGCLVLGQQCRWH